MIKNFNILSNKFLKGIGVKRMMNPEQPGRTIQCSQCGFMHPALPEGVECPMAIQKTAKGDVIDLDKFFISLKNILMANIKNGNIKDYKRFLAILLLKINKFAEKYMSSDLNKKV